MTIGRIYVWIRSTGSSISNQNSLWVDATVKNILYENLHVLCTKSVKLTYNYNEICPSSDFITAFRLNFVSTEFYTKICGVNSIWCELVQKKLIFFKHDNFLKT
jgi:hypothetical protein